MITVTLEAGLVDGSILYRGRKQMILAVENVYKTYGKEPILQGVSFTIERPEITALIGPNGSGKSTLMNIITNLLPANSGEVTVLNRSNKDPHIFKEIAYMQDNSVLYDYLTGYDHLQFIGDVQNISKDQMMKTARRVGIETYLNKRVRHYSLGMKQHLLLTMALLNEPKLLILDEPLNGLDPTSAIRVRKLFLQLREQGTAILLSSHHLAEIDRVTSKVLFLKEGRLIKEDLSQYEQTYYELTVNDLVQSKETLEQAGYKVGISQGKLQVYLENDPINEVFQHLHERDIIIEDLEKNVFGSEDRYQRIFS